jgi:hypothetical protein
MEQDVILFSQTCLLYRYSTPFDTSYQCPRRPFHSIPSDRPSLASCLRNQMDSFLSTFVVVRPAARGSYAQVGPQSTANQERNEWSSLRDGACFRIGLYGTRCCSLPHTPLMPTSQSVPTCPTTYASNRIAEHIRSFPHPLLSVLQHADLTPGLDRNQQRMEKGTNHPRCAMVNASASAYAEPDGILQLSPDLCKQPHTQTHSFLSTSVVVRPAPRRSHRRVGPQPTANQERNE